MPTWGQNSCLLNKKFKFLALKIRQQTFLWTPIRKIRGNKIIQLKNRALHPNQAIWWCCQWAGGREASCHEYKSVSWLRRWIKYAGKPIHPSLEDISLMVSQRHCWRKAKMVCWTSWPSDNLCLLPIQEYMNILISFQMWRDGHKGLS